MRLPRWLQPPEFQEPDVTARVAALWWIALIFLAFGLASLLTVGFTPLDRAFSVPLTLVCNATWLGVLAFLRKGHPDAAARTLVWGLFGIETVSICLSGGILSPTLLAYVVVILAAGLLLPENEAPLVVLMTAAVTIGLATMRSVGIEFPNLLEGVDWIFVPILIAVFAGSYAIIRAARRQIRESERLTRRYERDLRQAQKLEALGRLAGGIAHDFNNLLTGILGFGEVLRLRTRNDEKAQQAADQVCSAAESAADLTAQLLAFSRRPSHRPGPVDLGDTLTKIEPMLSRLLGEDVSLVLKLEADLPRAAGQASLIEQIIVNLAVNARDAMPTGGTLTIETFPTQIGTPAIDPAVGLRVTDDGLGMDEAISARAFDPFFTTKRAGTGLGLSSVYGAVQQSGGEIGIESQPGAGTSIEVRLPAVARADETRSLHAVPDAAPSAPTGKHVLVAEDDDRVRELLVQVLENAGHHVQQASSGEAALDLALRSNRPIDLLVSDVVMGGLDGIELSETLARRNPAMRVLLVSGYPDRPGSTGRQIPESAAFLQKPFTPAQLGRTVAEVLSTNAPAPAQSA